MVICVGPASSFPCKKQYKVHVGQHLGVYVWATRALSLAKNNTKYTSEQHVWSYLLVLRALPLAKNNTKYTSGQHLGSYVWPTRTLPLAKNNTKCRTWIMRGHPAITVKLFLTWTAGVLAYGLVCAGPPDTMMATRRDCALVFDTDGGGRHVSRCVLSRARAHLAHAARAPHMARLARLEHAVHLAHVEHVAHLARQACLARLGPSVARTGSVLVPSSCPSKDGR